MLGTQITKRLWAAPSRRSGPDLPNGLGPLSKRTSARNWIGSAKRICGRYGPALVQLRFNMVLCVQIRYGPAFQMRYGSAYQTRYGCLPDYCQLQFLPYLRHLNTLNLANIGYI
ncbi:hypothetical protein KUCAC02_014443 [Chaenocephalus aceratus]|uniref:Uncharacterized protein n=1 Tax=Chaenocephalus aceratus TaxID=36190 RepID=A0ACB9WEQ2_CHAAC|nr:hypothetical protein KUCAC02_014443 [Chaenocephalus aceratus]